MSIWKYPRSCDILKREDTRLIIEMQKEYFDSLPNEKIGHVCFEPMVPIYQRGMRQRGGQDIQGFRTEFYTSLSSGQQALFMFFSFYDHAIKSNGEFQHIAMLYLSERIFSAVVKGAEYFKVESMQNLLLEIKKALSEQHETQNSRIDDFYDRLREIAPQTLTQMGAFIRDNPAEFISFE